MFLPWEREFQIHPTPYRSLYRFLGLSITISITVPCFLCSSPVDPSYANCTQPFKCGDTSVLGELKYPFWGINRASYCGKSGFEIKCVNNNPVINISTVDLQIIGSNPQAHEITVVVKKFLNNICPPAVFNKINDYRAYASLLSINSGSVFTNYSIRLLTILYDCPSDLGHQLGWSGEFSCSINSTSFDVHFVTHTVNLSLTSGCANVISLPIQEEKAQALDESTITLPKALDEGFEMYWLSLEDDKCKACVGSGGQCGYNSTITITQFKCYCPDKPYALQCPQSQPGPKKIVLIIASSVGIGLVMLGFLILFSFFVFRKCKPVPKNPRVEDMLKNYESLGPKRYTYANITKMTNSFREKLGEGGYGTVFKGTLEDGRAVAVKVWKQSKGDGHEFANEVVSISSTCHINVVPLLGFCFEGPKGALIYEFMPNGSLEKFIRRRDVNMNDQALSFQKLFEIAVGIARGLEYLHRDCNTRIVHFDIKPHNILLDAEMTPKISDFGLAKAFKQKESIISISGARGTAGYIAPEVFFSSFGGVTHKSDVYSYGMMVLEMVGCTKRADENVEHSSELYFPRWIYKQLERETTLDCAGRVLNDKEKELERKMVLVGLWCIQTNARSRPSMCRVVGMLEREVQLEVPPMPSLASPPRQQQSTDDGSGSFLLSDAYAPSNNPEISTSKVSM